MLSGIALLTVACVIRTSAAAEGVTKEEAKASPLTEHLLKLVNHFDNNIIGFHLVVPRDDEMAKGFDSKPAPISKILEYVSQINFLRNLIDNDPEVSLKKERSLDERFLSTTPSSEIKGSDPHHTDILIFSQNRPQSLPCQEGTSSGTTVEQKSALKGVFSKVTGSTPRRLAIKNSRRNLEPSNLSVLNEFEDGIRVFPLISVNSTGKDADAIKEEEEKRFKREIPPDVKIENLAYLVQPRASSNPSVLFVPRSIFRHSSNTDDGVNKPSVSEELSGSTKFKRAAEKENFGNNLTPLTFVAPLMDSALVLPLKSGNKENAGMKNDSPELITKEKNDDFLKGNINDGYNGFSEGSKKNLPMNANLFNSSGGIDKNDVNYTPNTSEDYSFAEILRESITDLVNGVDQESFDSPNFENPQLPLNRLNDYDVYLLVDDKGSSFQTIKGLGDEPSVINSDTQEVYSSPKSKLNRGNGYDHSTFFRLGQLCPNFSQTKRNKNICVSDSIASEPFNEINSMYKTKVGEILSCTKNGNYIKKLRRRKRGSNISYKSNEKFSTVNSGNKLFVKYDPKRFSLYRDVMSQNNLSSNRDKRSAGDFKPNSKISHLNPNAVLYEILKRTLLSKRETIGLGKSKNETDLLQKFAGRSNRSPGGIVMIPQTNRNFDLLIVYPYGSHNNKRLKTIVSKSVRKTNGFGNKKTKSPVNFFNSPDKVLNKLDVANLKVPEAPVDNSISNEQPSSDDFKNVVRLVDSFKSDANYDKDDSISEQTSARKDFNILPAALLSFRSSASNYMESSSQNLSEASGSGEKIPSQVPDFHIKLLQGETASPFRSKSLMDKLNISSSASVEALKSNVQQSSESEMVDSLALTTESADLVPPNSSEAINSPLKPFLNSNGFRVSNGSNLLIKLTELKSPLEPKVLDVEEYKMTTESSITSGVALMQKNFKKPFLSSGKSTKRPFGSFFKSSKKVAFTGTSLGEETKNMKNGTDQTIESELPTVNCAQCVNESCVSIAYTFTEGYDSCSVIKSTPAAAVPGADRSIVHTTRPWAAGASVTSGDEAEEATEEMEDVDDGYPDFAPVISVNIFPIVGGWRKPQIEALSLIKDLLKTAQQLKVEEEQLPTYLSELFEVSEDNKTQHKNLKTKDNIQKKLDTILSGQCSINDVLKLKLQNILQRSSNKPTKAKPTKTQPI